MLGNINATKVLIFAENIAFFSSVYRQSRCHYLVERVCKTAILEKTLENSFGKNDIAQKHFSSLG
jgi:hypothetical protein